MSKDIFNQLPTEEQPIAKKMRSISKNIYVPQAFQWTLESQLMDAYQQKSQTKTNWFLKTITTTGWAAAAVIGFAILNWTISSLATFEQIDPATKSTDLPGISFQTQVRQGDICQGTIAVGHGFSISLSNEDKTAFISLNEDQTIGELRSFTWSKDGKQLAVLGNTRGSGNIYLAESPSFELLQPLTLLNNPEFDYLYHFVMSHDGQQFVVLPIRDNKKFFLMNADGSGYIEKQLEINILGEPQFAPDGKSIFFTGADTSTFGLFEFSLDRSETRLISRQVEDETGFAWSPNGTQLAYFEMDRDLGEARLVVEEFASATKSILGTLPISRGSGSSIPDVANLSWSADGTKLVFEFGRNAFNRAIYLVRVDDSELIKVKDSAYAPTMSADGNCLAYISNNQVFITDLKSVPFSSTAPILLADLPPGKSPSDFRLDKLQWSP